MMSQKSFKTLSSIFSNLLHNNRYLYKSPSKIIQIFVNKAFDNYEMLEDYSKIKCQ